jgi:hypothetical protein
VVRTQLHPNGRSTSPLIALETGGPATFATINLIRWYACLPPSLLGSQSPAPRMFVIANENVGHHLNRYKQSHTSSAQA